MGTKPCVVTNYYQIAGNVANASTIDEVKTQQTAKQSTQKIMWGKSELTKTQIGRITFLKDVKVYKKDNNGKTKFHMIAKKGSMWRVHQIIKEGKRYIYDLGGGVQVTKSNLSKYEPAPTNLVQKQVKQYGALITWSKYGFVEYPQVHRLASKDVKDKINKDIKDTVEWVQHGALGAGGSANAYKVTENKNNRLEISFTVSGHTDDDNGYYFSDDYKLIYDLTTGNSDLIKVNE